MGSIYRVTFPNGKAYIGMTMRTPEERFAEHIYDSGRITHTPFYRALRKYGAASVTLDVIGNSDDPTALKRLEVDAIAACGTRSPGGYNATDGGDGAPKGHRYNVGRSFTAESLARMSAGQLRRGPQSAETRAKKSAASKGNKYSLGRTQGPDERRMRAIVCITGAPQRRGKSGFKGISWCRYTSRWRSHLTVQGKMETIGRFDCIGRAIMARKQAERKAISEVYV